MKINISILITIILVLSACSEDKLTSENTTNNAVPVTTAEVKKTTFTKTIELVGKTVPSEQVPVTSSIPSQITSVNVEDGDDVKSGDVLFTMDDTDIRQQLTQARSAVSTLVNTRNQISSAVQQQRATQSEINSVINDTITQLEDIELPEQIEGDDVISNVTDTLDQLKELTGTGTSITSTALPLIDTQLAQARKGVQEAERAILATKITAPIDGTIDRINVKEGAPALPGSPLAIISSKNELKAVFPVNEFQKQQLTEDMTITITFNDAKDSVDVPIQSLSDKPNPETNTYNLTVMLDQINASIPSDAIAEGKVEIQAIKDALVVSNDALLFEDDQPYVFVVRDGRAIQQNISIENQGKMSSHVSNGIKAGDLVVTDGKYQLTNRSKISFKK